MFSSDVPKRWFFQKKTSTIFFVMSAKMVCYKYEISLFATKQRYPFPEKIYLKVTFPASLKKMIFILENMVFLLKYHVDWHSIKSSRGSHLRCSMRKRALRNFAKFSRKNLCQSLFFNKVTDLRPGTLFKKRLCRRCFPVNFAKFLRVLVLQNTSGQLPLEFQWFSVLLWRSL